MSARNGRALPISAPIDNGTGQIGGGDQSTGAMEADDAVGQHALGPIEEAEPLLGLQGDGLDAGFEQERRRQARRLPSTSRSPSPMRGRAR